MGLLSKILIGLNIVVAGAFIYLASSVWGARQGWTYAVFSHTVAANGIPLEAEAGDGDDMPFPFKVNDAVRLDSIRKSTLQKLVPAGGADLGGEPVNSQTAEIKRVEGKVLGQIAAADGAANKRAITLKYLLNLARDGQSRDGAYALLRDLFTKGRETNAKVESALLARTPNQVDALKTLATISGGDAGASRKAILELLKSSAPLAISGDTPEQRAESERNIKNAVADIEKAVSGTQVDKAALDAGRRKLTELATREEAKALIGSISDLLAGDAKPESAARILRDIALAPAKTEAERAGINALADLMTDPNANPEEKALAAGQAFLKEYFEEAAMPATADKAAAGKGINEGGEKARLIAHILYHLDADKPKFEDRIDWHNRVATVVGMNRYVEAANSQAIALSDTAARLRGMIREEEAVFRSDYLGNLRRALEEADKLGSLKLQLESLLNQKTTHEDNYATRVNERKDLEQLLETSKVSAKQFLGILSDREKEIFKLLNELNAARDELIKLEATLRKKEQQVIERK